MCICQILSNETYVYLYHIGSHVAFPIISVDDTQTTHNSDPRPNR